MNHSTVEDLGPVLSEKSTKTGGPTFSVSNKSTIIAAYPGSPIIGTAADYNKTHVASLKFKMLRNIIEEGDINDAEGYYGFPTTESTEEQPSSPDLTYSGAPFVPGVTTDANGTPIASPYMPNLLPPVSMTPAQDNPVPVVLDPAKVSLPPFVGDGLASPKEKSDAMMAQEKTYLEQPEPVAPHQQPGSSTSPIGGV